MDAYMKVPKTTIKPKSFINENKQAEVSESVANEKLTEEKETIPTIPETDLMDDYMKENERVLREDTAADESSLVTLDFDQ